MPAVLTADRASDARLWLVALLSSLALNVVVVFVLAILAVRSLIFATPVDETASASSEERVIRIQPVTRAEPEAPVEKERLGFARTSDDQTPGIPDDPRFMGERDTLGTSERAPQPDAPELPSQDGIEPRVEGEVETTVSDYQDGRLDRTDPAGAPAEPTAAADPSEAAEPSESPDNAGSREAMSPPALAPSDICARSRPASR